MGNDLKKQRTDLALLLRHQRISNDRSPISYEQLDSIVKTMPEKPKNDDLETRCDYYLVIEFLKLIEPKLTNNEPTLSESSTPDSSNHVSHYAILSEGLSNKKKQEKAKQLERINQLRQDIKNAYQIEQSPPLQELEKKNKKILEELQLFSRTYEKQLKPSVSPSFFHREGIRLLADIKGNVGNNYNDFLTPRLENSELQKFHESVMKHDRLSLTLEHVKEHVQNSGRVKRSTLFSLTKQKPSGKEDHFAIFRNS